MPVTYQGETLGGCLAGLLALLVSFAICAGLVGGGCR